MPDLTTYALLDCAAYDDAYEELTRGFPLVRWQSLFAGTPEADLVSAAPLLIELGADETGRHLRAMLLKFERMAPGVSWLESRYSLPVLAGMLTQRLPCQINDGESVLLRFFDPRILLGLPSALHADQKAWFFAPVQRWTAWEARRELYLGIDPAPVTGSAHLRYAVMPLALDQRQRERLMYYDKENLYDSIIAHWEATCPDAIEHFKPAILREIAAAAVARCTGYGLTGAADQHLFAGLMMEVSPSFDAHPAVQRYLRDKDTPPEERLSKMIAGLPDTVWHELEDKQRMEALFDHALAA